MGAKIVLSQMAKCYDCDGIGDNADFVESDVYVHSSEDLTHQDGNYGDYHFDSPCSEETRWQCPSCEELVDSEPELLMNAWECTKCETKFEEKDEAADCCG